ncbi:MAG: transporter substrate-binding domain-containing protein [Deltaproteobacteria bacterium]|jgi:branched-chain amino acid transport system substrate-binding protein|nr:transporter substrate-binding domain-containing protein [Deltaproteobacteria bacterium]
MRAIPRRTSEPWRVGVLFSRSGCTSVIEETQLRGTLLALEEINASGGIHGREVVPIVYDPASDPGLFASCAKRLMVENGVTTIFGCYTSSSRKAVIPVVERLNGLLWYPTPYEGFEFSPNVIYTGPAPNQNSVALCRFLMQHYGSRFYLIGSDYVYPRESNRVMRELVRDNSGSVVGETYLSLRAQHRDFLPVLCEVRRLQPDVIFSTVVGESTACLYQRYSDTGLDPRRMPIASLTTSEAEVMAMGADVGQGHITAAPYFESVRTPANSSFVACYRKRFGNDQPTNMCAEAAYFQVHLFAKALAEANSLETDILRSAVLGLEFDAPQGRVSVNETYGHADLWTRIGRVDSRGGFEVIEQSRAQVRADPYLIESGRAL